MLVHRDLFPLGELGVPDRGELALQPRETVLQHEVALAVRSVDRVQVSLVEEVLGRLAPRVRAVLVEAPDVRILSVRGVRVTLRLQVGLRDEMLPLMLLGLQCHSYPNTNPGELSESRPPHAPRG